MASAIGCRQWPSIATRSNRYRPAVDDQQILVDLAVMLGDEPVELFVTHTMPPLIPVYRGGREQPVTAGVKTWPPTGRVPMGRLILTRLGGFGGHASTQRRCGMILFVFAW